MLSKKSNISFFINELIIVFGFFGHGIGLVESIIILGLLTKKTFFTNRQFRLKQKESPKLS